jgi:nucleotide-binding universal stress UspA family protein
MRNILVPTDFSAESRHAYQMAVQLAQHLGGNITLLHVLEPPRKLAKAGAAPLPDSEEPGDEEDALSSLAIIAPHLLAATTERLQAFKTAAGPHAAGTAVAEVVVSGRVGPGILGAIKRYDAHLVVMGAQGHGAAQHLLFGSNTERLIRLAACPVLTIKNEPREALSVRTILFPSDFDEKAPVGSAGLRQVQAAFPEADLHLLHVRKNRKHGPVHPRIRAFAERACLHNVHIAVVEAATTAAGIAQYAQRVEADLVVMPTHARTGLAGFLRPSIAESVATHAFPPVLTYHLVRLNS